MIDSENPLGTTTSSSNGNPRSNDTSNDIATPTTPGVDCHLVRSPPAVLFLQPPFRSVQRTPPVHVVELCAELSQARSRVRGRFPRALSRMGPGGRVSKVPGLHVETLPGDLSPRRSRERGVGAAARGVITYKTRWYRRRGELRGYRLCGELYTGCVGSDALVPVVWRAI